MKFVSLFAITAVAFPATAKVTGSRLRVQRERKLPSEDDTMPCFNTEEGNGIDSGCTADRPICGRRDGVVVYPGGEGSYCLQCVNNHPDDLNVDDGCDTDAPNCAIEGLGYGFSMCFKPAPVSPWCVDTESMGAQDLGCSLASPVCTDSATNTVVGVGSEGDQCSKCVRVAEESQYGTGEVDYGCGSDRPRCMASDGSDVGMSQAGGQCCQADGDCSYTCPCNTPGSDFRNVMELNHPLPITFCIYNEEGIALTFDDLPEPYDMLVAHLGDSSINPTCAARETYLDSDVSKAEAEVCYQEIMSLAETYNYDLTGCGTDFY